MKRALMLLSLILAAACASNDGFVENPQNCGPGSEIGIDAGWDMQGSAMESSSNRLTMLVRVANNSNREITVKRVYVDPMSMNEDSPYELVRGATDPMKVIAEGEESTFEVQMTVNRRMNVRRSASASSAAEVSVTVLLEPEQSYRCRFRVPMGF